MGPNLVTVPMVQLSRLDNLDNEGNIDTGPKEFDGSLTSGTQGWVVSREV